MHVGRLKWIGVLLSLALIGFIASRFDFAAALAAVSSADPRWLALAALAYMAQFPLRGLRWSVLMRAVKPVSFRSATEVFAIGFMANNALPARLGDVARAFILARREGVPVSATFSNVMLERIFDGLVVVGFLCGVLWIAPPPAGWVHATAYLMAAVFSAAVTVSALIAWNEARFVALAERVLRALPGTLADRLAPRVLGLVERLARGLHCLRSAGTTILVIGLSLVIWSSEIVVYALAQRALGIAVPYLGLTLVMAVLTLGLTAPSAPGFIGVYEGLIIAGLEVYGVRGTAALAFALTMHVIHYVPGTLLGLLAAWRSGTRVGELRQVEVTLASPADDAAVPRSGSQRRRLEPSAR